jgi:hypothetical protein
MSGREAQGGRWNGQRGQCRVWLEHRGVSQAQYGGPDSLVVYRD